MGKLLAATVLLALVVCTAWRLASFREDIKRPKAPNPHLADFTRYRDVDQSQYTCPTCSWSLYTANSAFIAFDSLALTNDEHIPKDFPPLLCLPDTFGYSETAAMQLFPYTGFNACDSFVVDKRPFLHLDMDRNLLWMNCSSQQIEGKEGFLGKFSLDAGAGREQLGSRPYSQSLQQYRGVVELLNDEEFAFGTCKEGKTEELEYAVYRNRRNNTVFRRAKRLKNEDLPPLIVLILTLDSVSRRNFYRKMPLTADFLRNLSSSFRVFDFKLSNVMGEYSADNILPMLYGEVPVKMLKSIPDTDVFYDRSIYKLAKEHGFVTAFLEDNCGDDLARYMGRRIDTDHLGSYFWCGAAQYHHYVNNSPKQRCIGQVHSHTHAYRYLSDLRSNYPGTNQFAFMHINTAHEPTGLLIETLDSDTRTFLADFLSDARNDYAIVLNGDHGMRYGDWFKKLDGSKEHRLPLLHWVLSDRLLRRFPFSYDVMTHNSNRLVSKLDLYTTLQHLIRETQAPIDDQTYTGKTQIGPEKTHHLLREKVNNNRTCEEAGIPPFWCSCLPFYEATGHSAQLDSFLFRLAAETVEQLNEDIYTAKVPGHAHLCEKLTLSRVVKSWVLSTTEDYYKFQFTVQESDSVLFEAVVLVTTLKYRQRKSTDSFSILPIHYHSKATQRIMYVRRIDAYAGLCEQIAKLKGVRPDFCLCKSPTALAR